MNAHSAISIGLPMILAMWFGTAAFHKLRTPNETRRTLASYRLFPGHASSLAPFVLASVEVLVALLLLIPALTTAGLVLAASMLGIFATAMAFDLARGDDHDCGCLGGARPVSISWWLVGRNLFVASAALALAATPNPAIDFTTRLLVSLGLVGLVGLLAISSEYRGMLGNSR